MEPPAKKARTGAKPQEGGKKLVVVIENATLEVVKAGKDHHLLNCDDHQHIIRKVGKNIADCRPDITHQMLLALLDAPINKAGLLQVYIHTAQNVLIEVNPQIRIPRTFKRFCGLFVKLLHKLKIRSASGDATLLKVVRNPVESHLPPGCRKIACSFSANKLVDLKEYVPRLPPDEPVCFVIGGFAHGDLMGLDYAVRRRHRCLLALLPLALLLLPPLQLLLALLLPLALPLALPAQPVPIAHRHSPRGRAPSKFAPAEHTPRPGQNAGRRPNTRCQRLNHSAARRRTSHPAPAAPSAAAPCRPLAHACATCCAERRGWCVQQEEFISFSEYPLSAQVACSRLLTTFEQHWGIL